MISLEFNKSKKPKCQDFHVNFVSCFYSSRELLITVENRKIYMSSTPKLTWDGREHDDAIANKDNFKVERTTRIFPVPFHPKYKHKTL